MKNIWPTPNAHRRVSVEKKKKKKTKKKREGIFEICPVVSRVGTSFFGYDELTRPVSIFNYIPLLMILLPLCLAIFITVRKTTTIKKSV